MKTKITLFLTLALLSFSCDKDEQSCSDGVFSPGKETKVDCGGVCPPCDFTPSIVDTYLTTQVNGNPVSFSSYSLTKNPDWILNFNNDSLSVNINFGSGDSLGGRPMTSTYSVAELSNVNYSTLNSGFVILAEIDHTEKLLSGYFTAKFISDVNVFDTLVITTGEFAKINW